MPLLNGKYNGPGKGLLRRRPGNRINVYRECKERARKPITDQIQFKAAFTLKVTGDTLGLRGTGPIG
jgi:hypothetical protein